MKDQRIRFKLYPAPKQFISAEAFKAAVLSRRRAEALAHVQSQAAVLERLQLSESQAQPAQHAATHVEVATSNGHSNGLAHPDSDGVEPMATDEQPAGPPQQENGGQDGGSHPEQGQIGETESQHMLKRQQDKANRKAERQAEVERQWREQEAERLRRLEQQQAARAELDVRRERQAAELAALKARLEGMKVEKHGLVMQLKQVLASDDIKRTKEAALAAMEDGEVAAEHAAPAAGRQESHAQAGALAGSPASLAAPQPPLASSLTLLPHGGPAPAPLPVSPAPPSLASARARALCGLPLPPHLAALAKPAPQPSAPISLPPHLQAHGSLEHRPGAL